MFTKGWDDISPYTVSSIYWPDVSEMCLGVSTDVNSELLLQSLTIKPDLVRLWPLASFLLMPFLTH